MTASTGFGTGAVAFVADLEAVDDRTRWLGDKYHDEAEIRSPPELRLAGRAAEFGKANRVAGHVGAPALERG